MADSNADVVSLPTPDREVGSPYDWLAGDLLFPAPNQPGAAGDVMIGELREPNEPSIRELYECLRDGKSLALERGLTLPIKAAKWAITPPKHDQSALAGQIAEEVNDIFTLPTSSGGMKIPMQNIIAQATTAFWARRAYWELVYTRRDMKLVYDKIAWRPPDTCWLLRDRQNGDMRGFAQQTMGQPDKVIIRPPYSFVYVHGKHRDPIKGLSDFDVVYRNYRTKQKIKFLWMTYLESSALPKIIAVTKGTEGKNLANLLAAVRNAGAVSVPSNWLGDGTVSSIKTIDMAGQGQTDFRNALNWLDADSADSLLQSSLNAARAAATSAGPGMPGVTDQTEFFQAMLNEKAQDIATDITNTLIGQYVLYNHGANAPVPVFEFEDLNPSYIARSFEMLDRVAMAHQFNLPPHFVKELVIEVGRQMGMDIDALEKSTIQWMEQMQKEEQAALDRQALITQHAVSGAAQLAGTAQAGVAAVAAGQPVSPNGQPIAPKQTTQVPAQLNLKPKNKLVGA